MHVHDRYLKFIVSDIFKFYINQSSVYFNEVFCLIDGNGVATCSCKKTEVTFL